MIESNTTFIVFFVYKDSIIIKEITTIIFIVKEKYNLLIHETPVPDFKSLRILVIMRKKGDLIMILNFTLLLV